MKTRKTHVSASVSPEAGQYLRAKQIQHDWPIRMSWLIEKAIWAMADDENYDGPRPLVRNGQTKRIAIKTSEMAIKAALGDAS